MIAVEERKARRARRDAVGRDRLRWAVEELPGRWLDVAVRMGGTEVSQAAAWAAHRRVAQ